MIQLNWIAYYEDGKILTEADTPYIELDRSGLCEFILKDKDKTVASVKPKKDEQIFYRRRDLMPLCGGAGSVWHLVGARSKGKLRLQIITPNGTTLQDNQFRNQWYEPQWFKNELLDEEEELAQRIHLERQKAETLVNIGRALHNTLAKPEEQL